jgi:hypothetical protein
MTSAPTPEGFARAILSLFKSKDVRSNEMLVAGQVNQQFLMLGGNRDDYTEGLKYAIARGWLEPLTRSRFRLTETGFIEMRSSHCK